MDEAVAAVLYSALIAGYKKYDPCRGEPAAHPGPTSGLVRPLVRYVMMDGSSPTSYQLTTVVAYKGQSY